MEINKQLFEDILSGKLKGTFVLRNKQIIKSNVLKRSSENSFPYKILIKYDNGTLDYGTFKSNGDFEFYSKSHFDIVDFIPDTNMKENKLTIEIPDGKIVDWEESKKQNKIILKDKQLTYEDICEKLFKDNHYTIAYNASNATIEHQLECILAKNKLANVAKYLNDGWKPDKRSDIYYLNNFHGNLVVDLTKGECSVCLGQSIFKSKELARQAIEILGEETVKLALEPLGI